MSPSSTRLNVVIGLLVVNLLATLWLGLAANGRIARLEQARSEADGGRAPLPAVLDETVRSDIYRTFVVHYNAGDYDAVYDSFGSYARARIPRDALVDQFDRLRAVFGDIVYGSYSRHEFENRAEGVDFVHLIYDVSLDEDSAIGGRAELVMKVLVKGVRYETYGVTLKAVDG
jgi:hypothetical protein